MCVHTSHSPSDNCTKQTEKKISSYVFSLDKFILLMIHCVGKGLKMSHPHVELE